MAHGERDADEPAERGSDEDRRLVAADALEPRGNQIGEAERGERRDRTVIERPPRGAVARPARTQDGHAQRIDQIGRVQARPPRLHLRVGSGVTVEPVAERKRRGRDATNDDDHGRGAQGCAEHVPAEDDVIERVSLDHHRVAVDFDALGDHPGAIGQRRYGGHASGIVAETARAWACLAARMRAHGGVEPARS
jgi:hypothetical protein